MTDASAREMVEHESPRPEDDSGLSGWLQRLTRAAARELPASGAGITVMETPGLPLLIASSDQASAEIEEQQLVLGEGPCMEAYASGLPVLMADLVEPGSNRFPMYVHAVSTLGVGAAFAFPLQIGASTLGVLDVFRRDPGRLSAGSLSLALSFADVAMQAFLDAASGMTDGGPLPLDGSLDHRREIYQAQGLLSVQLGVGLPEAMSRMRAFAFTEDRRLLDVAIDILARRIDLSDDGQ